MANGGFPITSNGKLEMHTVTFRDYVGVLFRHRNLVIKSFIASFLGAALIVIVFVANRYQAEMKVLVNKDRSDPVVSAGRPNEQMQQISDAIAEQDVNTEVSLLQDDDLMREVVLANGLQNEKFLRDRILFFLPLSSEERIQKAVINLQKALKVEPEAKTNLIDVTYTTYFDRAKAARVLHSLQDLYVAKHVAVHVPQGAEDFFDKETSLYKKSLADSEAKLASYSRDKNAVSPQLERDYSVQNVANFTATLRQTQASIKETQERIQHLEGQLKSASDRVTTLDHVADPWMLLQQQNTTLLNLELQHTQMLTKYDPSYPAVRDLEKQIEQTKQAIAEAQKNPVHDTTTDHDPTYELIREDLAKSKAQLASLKGLETGTSSAIARYRTSTVNLEQRAIEQQDLAREAKADEDNYLLYLHKREEARVASALDKDRFANVTIAQQAIVPALPAFSPMLGMVLAFFMAGMVSVGSAFAAEVLNDSIRTPDEVTKYLEVPVFASIPEGKA
jgi:uncharacterized protein involved in exopolysaccharide biosynthesis